MMTEKKRTIVQALVIGTVLILTLPLIYLLFSRVLLPLEWSEPQFEETSDSVVEPE